MIVFVKKVRKLMITQFGYIVRHMRPQNGDFRCTPLFRWVSWYRYVGNILICTKNSKVLFTL